jgi:hypothetical protein
MRSPIPRALALCLALGLATPVRGGDGVREINQAGASGDASALHVISAPGSYRLTGDLLVPNGLDGIRIEASDVTLDLSGFTISSQGAFGLAIHGITAANLSNIEIRNGTVRGFPTSGVHLPGGRHHRVIDVRAIDDGNFGINFGDAGASDGGHLVRGCTAVDNSTGMRVLSSGSLVVDSVARDNSGTVVLM